MIGTYMYGIIQWSPGPIQGAWVLPVVQFASLVRVRRLVSYYESLWWPMYECFTLPTITVLRYLLLASVHVWS